MGSSADGESSVSGPGGGRGGAVGGISRLQDFQGLWGSDPVGRMLGGEGLCSVLPTCLSAR